MKKPSRTRFEQVPLELVPQAKLRPKVLDVSPERAATQARH